MSQEYYSVEKESNLGALNIGLSVFQAIVVKAVESVDGVQFEGNMIPMPGSGPVRTNINKNNQVIIDVDVLIDYMYSGNVLYDAKFSEYTPYNLKTFSQKFLCLLTVHNKRIW